MKTASQHCTEQFSPDSEYSLLMSSLNVSVSKHLLDDHFTLVWANSRHYEMFGYTKEEYEAQYHNCCDVFYQKEPEEWAVLVNTVTAALKDNKPDFEYIGRVRHKNGNRLWVKLVGNFTNETINGYQVSYCVMMDVTEQMQSQLEQSVAYDNLPGCIAKCQVTEDGFRIIEGNQKFSRLFGDVSFISLNAGKSVAIPPGKHGAMRSGKHLCFVLAHQNRGGRTIWLRVSGECVDMIGEDPVYLLMYIDITDLTEQQNLQKRTQQKLEQLAFVDPVTDGLNQTRFEIDAGQAILAAKPGSYVLVWLNMQKFKLINDFAGTEAGNQALKYVYDVIGQHLELGEYVARLSADNYAILLKFGTRQNIEGRLNEMVEAINVFNQHKRKKYILSFTAGIYRVTDPTLPMTQIQDRAHVARKSIRHISETTLCACMFYNDLDRLQLMQEKEIENRMRDALEQQEFEVYLQPKLALRSNKIAGAEALIRWNDPEKGMVFPNEFIPYFEKNGFVIELDLYVFEKVCALLRKWIDQKCQPVPISVNMSRIHLLRQDFLEPYQVILNHYQVPAQLLEIELTETMAFHNPQILTDIIREIHQHGFRCSIDDFGSGYSSLNVLKDMEVDTLKLDQSFCSSDQIDNPRERIVIASVVELAKKLGMSTVAEGVETQPQVEFLQQSDCDVIQGYVFSRAVPPADFEKLAFGKVISPIR